MASVQCLYSAYCLNHIVESLEFWFMSLLNGIFEDQEKDGGISINISLREINCEDRAPLNWMRIRYSGFGYSYTRGSRFMAYDVSRCNDFLF
jgi:hypothetical protein